MNESASKHYQTQQIMTASPAMLVHMLLDKAIVSLKEAIRAIESKNVEARWKANARAMEIITHLRTTLDHKQGGEIARNLDQLYGFMLTLLPQVDFANDTKAAQSVIDLLTPFRASWKELAARGAVKRAPNATAQGSSKAPPKANQGAPAATPATTAERASPTPDRPKIAISA